MDIFNRCILSVLRDGEAKYFKQILFEVDFSPNSLRQHLDKLMNKGMVKRSKKSRKGLGRPDSYTACPETSMTGPLRPLVPLQWVYGTIL